MLVSRGSVALPAAVRCYGGFGSLPANPFSGGGKIPPECSSRTHALDLAAENWAVFVGNIARGWTDATKSSKEQGNGSQLPKRLSEVPR